jgi:hypothetical protein
MQPDAEILKRENCLLIWLTSIWFEAFYAPTKRVMITKLLVIWGALNCCFLWGSAGKEVKLPHYNKVLAPSLIIFPLTVH